MIKDGYSEKGQYVTQAYIRGLIRKFPDWPPGERTANGTALCH